ncbi:MAG: ATP-binding cassette domain-containing protein [Actinophytocola sp.]|uniref:ATP-binding cassette domain-containing protein n=1 Tax=Actinophytocola sp. TaxID=1872138 RepID=UPI00132860C0|nr:ATP-binding cassette domain-containing protein [Actinophytocola sp.]MPZ85912.1 ATP-binding cassette domain-containing protein [Actinophytocola sp.]
MRPRRPATLRTRLLLGLLLVAVAVIVAFDVATVAALRESQTRRIDGILDQVAATHEGRATELVHAADGRQPPPMLPGVAPNDYYLVVATSDRGTVRIGAPPEVSPRLPADLGELARSGDIRTVPGTDGAAAFRLRAVATEAGTLVIAVNLRSVTDAIHKLQAILAVATIMAMAVLAAGGLAVVRRGLRPLEAMASQADRITAGDLTRPVAPQTPDTEVGRLGRALNRMLTRIHASVREQQVGQERMRRFFADASHELRTPLTSLRANAELYEQGALASRPQVDEAMRRIRVSAQRMSTLVDDMLRLARLDQEPRARTDTVDLSALLADSLRDGCTTDPDRSWAGEIQPGLTVHGDQDLLRRAVDNLLANIRTHTPTGTTGTLTARRDGADEVVIEVGDDGPGVPGHELPRLFDRFHRVDGHHTGTGSGLGLAIVAEVAAGHGGGATAVAATPRGLRIRLTLPIGAGTSTGRRTSSDDRARPSPSEIERTSAMTMVAFRGLTKRFGQTTAVEDLTFDVPPGRVTGFLGPNGAGKTTTLRMLLGLVHPTDGEALIDGRRYADLTAPRRTVGAVLDSTGFHPGRRGRDEIRVHAAVTGVPDARVDEVLDQVGLTADADRRVGGYSLGMRQRLSLAAALLGDPRILILDEPANGLDPEGMAWLRDLLRELADAGRTILISSHVLSEVAQIADHAVIINHGRLRFAGPLAALGEGLVSVRTSDTDAARRLRRTLAERGIDASATGTATLQVRGATAEDIGRVAVDERIVLAALTETSTSLEATFLDLTRTDPTTPTGAR